MFGKQKGSTDAYYLIPVVIWLAAIVGWVMNIITVVQTVSEPITGMFVLRCVGILAAPLGAVLGYF